MQEFLFALTLSALPVVSNFMGAMIAEALPSSKQTLGLVARRRHRTSSRGDPDIGESCGSHS
ncbi:hypothetical protein [Nostoc sp. CALU 1950]|uniref:hypothetical protein n=1 Tax=Nostoc sp. CALU 1950 TaxID=3104321 RepID=UPI003EBDB80E